MNNKEGKIKALTFDIGGVTFLPKNKSKPKNILSSYKELCLLLRGVKMSGKEIYEKTKKIYFESTRGKISKKQVIISLSRILNLPKRKIESLFANALKENIIENQALINLILRLKKRGYKMGILSIQWHLSKDILVPKRYNKIFDKFVVSCDDKIRKPKLKSYKLLLKKLNVKPSETLFVDDKQENLDAAARLGIKILIFRNNKQFFREIKKFNL